MERWSILSTKVDHVEYNRKALLTNRVKFNPTERICLKGCRKIKGEGRTCQEIDFDNMTEQLQTDHLDRYEGVQAGIHQVSQFDEPSAVSTTYLGKVNMSRKDAFREQEQYLLTDQLTTFGTILDGTNCKIILDSGLTTSFMSK